MKASRALGPAGLFCSMFVASAALSAGPGPGQQAQSHAVAETYNGRPFSYQIELVEEADTHRLYRVRYPSPITTAVAQNDFFAQDLPAAARVRPPAPRPGPLQAVMRLLAQAALFLGPDPPEGRGHMVDLEADVTQAGRKPLAIRLRMIRGWAGRFRIEAQAPPIGRVALGLGDYPWMLAAGNTVFKGVPASPGPTDPLAQADPRHLLKLRVLAGALGAAGMAPQVLESLATVADDSTPTEQAVRMETKDARRGAGRLVLKPDGGPARLSVTVRGVQVEVRFRQWQPNTVIPAELFVEPAGVQCQEVDRADLERMFSAMFNLAMDSL